MLFSDDGEMLPPDLQSSSVPSSQPVPIRYHQRSRSSVTQPPDMVLDHDSFISPQVCKKKKKKKKKNKDMQVTHSFINVSRLQMYNTDSLVAAQYQMSVMKKR
jgi:hypothetical protein